MNRPETRRKNSRPGFTLTELLVTIAIIAVLAAMLFLIAGRTKSAARAATCVSNQRQIVSGMIEWVHDNNNIMPDWVRKVGSNGGGYYWYADISYAPGSPGGNTLPAAPHKPLRTGEDPGIWVCPANDPFKTRETRRSISYTANNKTLGSSRRYLQMSAPSRTIAICDANLSGPNNYRIRSDADIGHIHGDGVIAAFWDGHVAKLSPVPEFDSRAFSFSDE